MLMLMKVCVLLAAALAAALAFALAVLYFVSKRVYPLEKADAIIVPGARILPDASPSATLQYRLDAAKKAYDEGWARVIIVTGGKGPDEPKTEACAMKRYLVSTGVAQDAVLEENTSVNTILNLKNAKQIMDDNGLVTAIIATTDYHLPRAMFIARRLKIPCFGIPSKPGRRLKTKIAAPLREVLSWGMCILKAVSGKIR